MDNHVVQTSRPSVPHTRGTQLRDAPEVLGRRRRRPADTSMRKARPLRGAATLAAEVRLPALLPSARARAGHTHRPLAQRGPINGRAVSVRAPRPGRPRGRAPTRGFQEASAGLRPPAGSPRSAARVPVGAHWRARADAPTRARRVPPPPPLPLPAAARDSGAALGPPPGSPRPPRTWWGGGGDRASRPASKLSRTLLRGAREAATRVRGARAAELTAQLWAVSPEAAPPPPAPSVAAARPRAPANNRRP